MKKYMSPEVELLAFYAQDAIMSSNENESDRDIFMDEALNIGDIRDI